MNFGKNVRILLPMVGMAFLLAGTTPVLPQNTPKIAVINLKRVFDNYYKTKQADAQLKDRAAEAEKVLKGMMEDYQKANEAYKKLIDAANDQALSISERERQKKAAEAKLVEAKDIEQSVIQFRRTTQTTLEEQKNRMREKILEEIQKEVTERAKAENFSMVLDTAGESINKTMIILYHNGQNDITDAILAKMNANAPPEFSQGSSKP